MKLVIPNYFNSITDIDSCATDLKLVHELKDKILTISVYLYNPIFAIAYGFEEDLDISLIRDPVKRLFIITDTNKYQYTKINEKVYLVSRFHLSEINKLCPDLQSEDTILETLPKPNTT